MTQCRHLGELNTTMRTLLGSGSKRLPLKVSVLEEAAHLRKMGVKEDRRKTANTSIFGAKKYRYGVPPNFLDTTPIFLPTANKHSVCSFNNRSTRNDNQAQHHP